MSIPKSATSARNEVRAVAPRLIELTESLVYGDLWERPGLSKRDRSLTAMSAGRLGKRVFDETKS